MSTLHTGTDSVPTVLSIGGLDPWGGAGILVDAAACRAAGAHAACVLAVTTVQSSDRFSRARPIPPDEIRASAEAVIESLDVRAVKTGALGGADQVDAVADLASRLGLPNLVLDPVLSSTTGGVLLDGDGIAALVERLFPLAALVTPNLDEAGALIGEPVGDIRGMRRAARRIIEAGARAVLVKGGHLKGEEVQDLLVDRAGNERLFSSRRQGGRGVRGTGCALASLIAAMLARGLDLQVAVEKARPILEKAILGAMSVGPGPLVLGLGRQMGV